MTLKPVLVILLSLFTTLTITTTSSFAGDASRKGEVIVCGQQSIHGFASAQYDDIKSCNADKKKLSEKAVENAKSRCNKFCDDMKCNPPKYPALKGSASCKLLKKKAYGNAKTVTAVTCRCTL